VVETAAEGPKTCKTRSCRCRVNAYGGFAIDDDDDDDRFLLARFDDEGKRGGSNTPVGELKEEVPFGTIGTHHEWFSGDSDEGDGIPTGTASGLSSATLILSTRIEYKLDSVVLLVEEIEEEEEEKEDDDSLSNSGSPFSMMPPMPS